MIEAKAIADALGGAKSVNEGASWNCRCPVHDDARGSLNVRIVDDKVLVRCYAGCDQTSVLEALRSRGLMNGFDRGGDFDFAIGALGKPTNVWTYRDAAGATELLKVARYAAPGGKEIRPWIRDGARWKCAAHPTPRPLYGLETLSRSPASPVLVTEGEKACDAARDLVGTRYVVMTWPGGANAADKADWTPLRARAVTLWPDADGPGEKAMQTAAARLAGLAASVAIVEPGDRAAGWDLADAKAEGWSGDDVATFIDEHSSTAPTAASVATEGQRSIGEDWPSPIDLVRFSEIKPQAPQFIVPDWLPAAYATLLAGHGGIGKSGIALHLAVCIALGRLFFGLQTERRRVAYLSCEDREGILHWRLARICDYLGVGIGDLAGWLDIRDLVGRDCILWSRDPRTGYTVTQAFASLAGQIETQRTQVLFVDGISDTFGGNENVRAEVKAYVNRILGEIPSDGALILLGHVNRMTAGAGASSEGYSGSTQWHNAVRARWYLYPEMESDDDARRRTGKLTLELQKSNHGKTDQALTFAWDDEAHMFLATETFGTSAVDHKHRDEIEQRGILAALLDCERAGIVVPSATQGKRTALNVLALRPHFPPSLNAAHRRFWVQIEALRQLRWIDETEYRRANRHHAAQFVLTSEGRVQCADS